MVCDSVRAALARLAGAGAELAEVSNPRHEDTYHAWVAICVEGAQSVMLKGNNTGTNWSGFYNTQLLDNVAKSSRARPNDMGVMVKYVLLFGEYMQNDYTAATTPRRRTCAASSRRATRTCSSRATCW